jgi:uncharacterized protein (TIGR02145 family)
MKNYKIAAALFLVCILFSCDKYDLLRNNPKDPNGTAYNPTFTLTTSDATLVTITSATLGGKIKSDLGVSITAKGVCWNTATNPTISNSKTSDGSGTTDYTSNLTGLTGGTTYYARAYATTSKGTTYADNIITFTTLPVHTAPILTTTAASAIGLTNAYSGGTISSNGGDPITARGVVWGPTANPTISLTTKTVDDSTTVGTFTNKLTPLTAGTTYHARAYATNVVGTGYGNDITFTTLTVAVVPTLTTTTAFGIAMTTAISGGNITFDGGANVTDRGVCWGTAINPSIALTTKTSDGTGTGIFPSSITGLTAGILYHVRAFATNSAGTGYGADITFTTNTVATAPTVNTSPVTDILLYTATSGGNVISDGGATVTTRGVCWATTINPTTSNSKINYGPGTGAYTCVLNLNLNTTYHVRAYATNSVGTSYGSDVMFTTLATAAVPTLTTTAVTAVTPNSATSGGNITSDGGATVTERGICWGTSANPTMPTTTKATDASGGTGTFTGNITGLSGSTVYHVRAYAKNSAGYGYGADQTFTTLSAVLATINTTDVTANIGTSAISGGTISSDGGAAITARGVCWGATVNPLITSNKTNEGTGTGTFVSNITGLTIGTTYHVRAYATSTVGTAYGQDVAFTTPSLPTVTTSVATVITSISATSGGNITSDGGSPVTESGICWSTSANPTTSLTTKYVSGSGSGTFWGYLKDLLGSTTYHIRAYATNSVGTAYGADVTFITLAPVAPTVTTSAMSAITLNTAVSGGEITSNGGAAITARGVCWNTVTAPTISNSKTSDGTTSGVFTSNLASLTANTLYYLRAYATNSAGTSYGSEILFKTALGTVADFDGNTYYTVGIGTQVWMRENLKTTKFRDGNTIENVTDGTLWSQRTTSAYSWYSNDIANKPIYGALYNFYATTDSRGLCPTSWHVPTDAEWTTLATTLGGSSVAGGKMKEPGNAHWVSADPTATNESGFTALGNGYRANNGSFTSLGIYNYSWSSTEYANIAYGYGAYIYYSVGQLVTSQPLQKTYGNAVRCIKD